MDESTRIRMARARALSSNRYTAGISVPSDVVMERRVGSQANFFNGALVGPCCVDGTAAEQEGYILRLQLIDRGRGIAGERNTRSTVFSVTLNNTTTIAFASEQLSTPGGIKIGARGNLLPATAPPSSRPAALTSVNVEGPGSLKFDISPTVTVDAVSLISTDPNVGDAGGLRFTNTSIKSVSVSGYYASGDVTIGNSLTEIDIKNLTGGNLRIISPSTVKSVILEETTLEDPNSVALVLTASAAAGTLSFFSAVNTNLSPAQIESISEAVTVIDAPAMAPTVTDVSDMSMVQLSYDGAVPSGFDLQYWLGVTPDFTDVSAGTFIPGGEAPFTPLSQTNYYFKCLFVRQADPPITYLASELSPASGLYFMPKAPDYTATNAAVTLTYTGTNTPPGATTVFYYSESASHTGLTQLPSNVYTYSGPISPALYFFSQLVLAGGAGATVISPATGPVLRPA